METNLQTTLTKTDNISDETNNKLEIEQNDANEEKGIIKQESNKNDCETEITELLGSVTTQNCPGTRFSARVIQKMKLDQTNQQRPITPPNDRELKKEEKSLQKTPSNMRANKPIWTNLERNHFFDALNEFGKDFEAIGNYINTKLKRKNAIDKTTHQVRQHYYQTYHKICKYIKYSDEIKKPVQELYALINYGEMRRKLQFVTDKHFMKLKNLIYQGHITVRCKGKNIRVKTPSCKALRRINQLDDTLEDIRLPSKIEVIMTPANMETFGRLQTIAQNPRVRCMVPLHKKLMNFIKTFQYKWRSPESRLAEEEAKLYAIDTEKNNTENLPTITPDTEICFQPKTGTVIHRPLLSITEHLSNFNICLSAYEERLGVKIRSETLSQDQRLANAKRQRTDSGSEKRSPETKKFKTQTNETETPEINKELPLKSESSSDEMMNDDLLNVEPLSDNDNMTNRDEQLVNQANNDSHNESTPSIRPSNTQQIRSKRGTLSKSIRTNSSTITFKPLLNADAIRRIRQGWTMSNAADITIGDLYVVFGQDSRLELEYYWTDQQINEKPSTTTAVQSNNSAALTSNSKSNSTETAVSIFAHKQSGMPYNPTECDDPNLMNKISFSCIGNKLKHLLLIANLSERIRKRQCSCGHICERNSIKTRLVPNATKNFYPGKPLLSGHKLNDFNKSNAAVNVRSPDGSVFRQPNLPPRRSAYNMDPVKQLAALSGQKMSRQVFVQRMLLPGAANQNHESESDKSRNVESLDTVDNKSNSATLTNASTASTSSIAKPGSEPTKVFCSFAGTVGSLSPSSSSSSANATHELNTPISLNTTNPMPHSMPTLTDNDCNSLTNIFGSMSPMHLIRETTSNSRWLEDNLNDFSLTSLLGHLDEINANRDILDPSNLSVISESSVDYMHKFQEISALMQKQDKDTS